MGKSPISESSKTSSNSCLLSEWWYFSIQNSTWYSGTSDGMHSCSSYLVVHSRTCSHDSASSANSSDSGKKWESSPGFSSCFMGSDFSSRRKSHSQPDSSHHSITISILSSDGGWSGCISGLSSRSRPIKWVRNSSVATGNDSRDSPISFSSSEPSILPSLIPRKSSPSPSWLEPGQYYGWWRGGRWFC